LIAGVKTPNRWDFYGQGINFQLSDEGVWDDYMDHEGSVFRVEFGDRNLYGNRFKFRNMMILAQSFRGINEISTLF